MGLLFGRFKETFHEILKTSLTYEHSFRGLAMAVCYKLVYSTFKVYVSAMTVFSHAYNWLVSVQKH